MKTDSDSIRGSSTSGGSGGPSGTASGAVSGSESQHGSEPPPSRQQRMGSAVSASEAQFPVNINSATNPYQPDDGSPRTSLYNEMDQGRPCGLSSPNPNDTPGLGMKRPRPWPDGQHVSGGSSSSGFPWLAQTSGPRGGPAPFTNSPDSIQNLTPGGHNYSEGAGRGSRSSASSNSRPPSIKTEQSVSSMSSLGSQSFPRTPSDSSLPIHALLSSKPEPSYPPPTPQQQLLNKSPPPVFAANSNCSPSGTYVNNTFTAPASVEQRINQPGLSSGEQAYFPMGFTNERHVYAPPVDSKLRSGPKPLSPGESGLDGISALLKAKEIVDRRTY